MPNKQANKLIKIKTKLFFPLNCWQIEMLRFGIRICKLLQWAHIPTNGIFIVKCLFIWTINKCVWMPQTDLSLILQAETKPELWGLPRQERKQFATGCDTLQQTGVKVAPNCCLHRARDKREWKSFLQIEILKALAAARRLPHVQLAQQ